MQKTPAQLSRILSDPRLHACEFPSALIGFPPLASEKVKALLMDPDYFAMPEKIVADQIPLAHSKDSS
jgi:hypothetical protein